MSGIATCQLDGKGAAHSPAKTGRSTAPGFSWTSVTITTPEGQDWLKQADLPEIALSALTAEETRPRCTLHNEFALLNLRGVNLNPGAEPEDMVSVRIYVSDNAVITVNKRPLYALKDLLDDADQGKGPISPGDLVALLALRLADRAEPVVAALNEKIDELEIRADQAPGVEMRSELADIRRQAIVLRRYMFPQRDALSTLEIEPLAWLGSDERARLREAVERVTRLAEELDSIRDRAQVVRDLIGDLRAEQMNRQMYILSVVTAIFLPLGLITGLLGVNIAGMPGTNWAFAFWVLIGAMVVTAIAEIWLFRRLGLIGQHKNR